MCDRPLLRIPQLAIHLDRDVNEQGLKLNPQQHLTPVWGTGPVEPGAFVAYLADEVGVAPDQVVAWDAMVHDLTPGALLGRNHELVSSARLDNLLSCWAGIAALVAGDRSAVPNPDAPVSVVCLFDHEEVGSTSATGRRRCPARPGARALRARPRRRTATTCSGPSPARSACRSTWPTPRTPTTPSATSPAHTVADRRRPRRQGQRQPALRHRRRIGHAVLVDACDRAGVPHQAFVSRNDQPCGSTIGPLTAARLGIATVDVGVAAALDALGPRAVRRGRPGPHGRHADCLLALA